VPRRRPNRSKLAAWNGLVIGLGAALALAGCASIRPAPAPIRPEAQAALALIERNREEFRDFRSLADVRITRDKQGQRFTGALLLRAPASLRFEALSPFGIPILLVGADGQTLTVWEVLGQRAYLLPASAEGNRRWLGLEIGVEELVALLSGHVVPLKDALATELLESDQVGPSLSLRDADSTQRIWFDPLTGRPRQVEWTGGGNPARVTFAAGASDVPPAALTLATLDGKLEVVVKYRDPKINGGFDPDLMKVSVPDGVRIQDLR
jgi:outer membrane lipoprotein-sorting protein